MLIKVIICAWEAPHGHHEVSNSAFEFLPVLQIVEELDGVGLNKDSVEIWEGFHDWRNEELLHKVFVSWHVMGLTVAVLDRSVEWFFIDDGEELLENLALKLEPRQVSTVSQHQQNFFENLTVEAHEEQRANLWMWTYSLIQVPQALQADLHTFWLFMLDGEDDRVNNGLESLRIQLDHSLGAMHDNIVDELEESFSEFWIWDEITRNHVECRLAETKEDLVQETSKHIAFLLHHGCEEHQSLWISWIWVWLLIVFHQGLQGWQEILVEILKISFFLNVGLNELQNISSHSLHWSHQVLRCTSALLGLADPRWVMFVYLDQRRKYLTQVCDVTPSCTLSNSLINLDNVVDRSDAVRRHEDWWVLSCSLQGGFPVFVGVAKQWKDKIMLPILLGWYHISNSFINHESLMCFEIFTILWDQMDQVQDIWLLAWLILLCEHMLRQLWYLQKCLWSHVLDPWVLFMHKFVQLFYHRF